jgi:hypothetical protein
MDRLGVRWAGNNGYNRNMEELIPALNRNTADTVIVCVCNHLIFANYKKAY